MGPIGVLPEDQGVGIGSALMNALLTAADAADVPMVVLLGAPQYYGSFGFRPAQELGVISPEPRWGEAFQARPLTAYTPGRRGTVPVRAGVLVLVPVVKRLEWPTRSGVPPAEKYVTLP